MTEREIPNSKATPILNKWVCMKTILFILLFFSACLVVGIAQEKPITSCGPIPSDNQLRWQQMEYYAFIHLSVNPYTDMAWGNGNEVPKMFNSSQLDCGQWARLCNAAG